MTSHDETCRPFAQDPCSCGQDAVESVIRGIDAARKLGRVQGLREAADLLDRLIVGEPPTCAVRGAIEGCQRALRTLADRG